MGKRKLAIAIPSSIISDTPHLREKTAKIGLIGRATAIFRVDEIIIYQDKPRKGRLDNETDLIALLLNYLETPQYFRKRIFNIEPRLKFAGILPPLRTSHHPLNRRADKLEVGEYREGIVISEVKEGMLVDIGVERPALLREKYWTLKKRLSLQLIKIGELIEVQTVEKDKIPYYWGYSVKVESHSFGSLLRNREFDLVLATSKNGVKYMDVIEQIARKWMKANYVLIAFGAPSRGLHEIVANEGLTLTNLVDFVVNTIPEQGTETVRTEEALLASLAVLNVQFC